MALVAAEVPPGPQAQPVLLGLKGAGRVGLTLAGLTAAQEAQREVLGVREAALAVVQARVQQG